MSGQTNSIRPLTTENVLDPRLEAMKYGQQKLKWSVFKGCQNQSWSVEQANSYSTAGANWSFNTSASNVLIDRRIFVRHQFQITFTGTAPVGQPLLSDELDAPRAMPIGSITSSLKATINGTSFNTQYSDVLECMLRYNNSFENRSKDLSQSPSMLDNYQNYIDGVGGVRNPLSTYDNGSYEIGRGAYKMDSIINPLSTDASVPIEATVVFTVTEPLLMSPFLYSSRHLESALYGVSNMGVSFSFKAGNLARIWSHAKSSGVTITNAKVDIGQGTTEPPQLLINYLTPPLLDSIGEVPQSPVYQYYKADTYINNFSQTLPPNQSTKVTNNSIQLGTIPSSIYLWFTRPEADKTFETTDTALRVDSLSIGYLNQSGQFSTMTRNDLFAMSCKNGLEMSWVEFNGLTQSLSTGDVKGLAGSFLKIDVEDLAMPDNFAAGVNTNSQLSITANVTNINQTETIGVQCNVVCIYEGMVTVTNGQTVSQIGVVDQADVIKTRQDSTWVDFRKAQQMYGGSFFSKLGSLAKMAPAAIHGASDLMKAVGMGGCDKGAGRLGGAIMSQKTLRQRLMDQ